MGRVYIGIDLGGTNIKFGLFDIDLNLIDKTSTTTKADMGPQAVIEKICRMNQWILGKNDLSVEDVGAVGIGVPGPSKISEGIILAAPNLPMFKNVPIREMLSFRLGKKVAFENDANIACWGEYVVGAGKGVRNMVFLTLGTGIGGGIINNGQLVHGCADGAAEIGHMIIYPEGRQCACGQKGCVEAYASANSTAARAAEAIQQGAESTLKNVLETTGRITCKDVYEHLAAGDGLAKKITNGTAQVLALCCVNILHITEPKRILFAGGMIAAGNILLDRIKDYFNEFVWPLKPEPLELCFASLGEDAGIIGAAALAKELR